MSKSKKKPSDRLWLLKELIDSKAFNSLTGYAPQLLLHIFKKRKFENQKTAKKDNWVCTNSDSLNITYVEFKRKYNVSKPRMSKALGQLLARGFITLIHQGGGCNKDKSIYALSDQWLFWQKGVVFEEREKVPVQRGYCKPNHGDKTMVCETM